MNSERMWLSEPRHSLSPSPFHLPSVRNTTVWCIQEQDPLLPPCSRGGLSPHKGHSTPSYLLLRLNSRWLWLTGRELPSSTQCQWHRLYLGKGKRRTLQSRALLTQLGSSMWIRGPKPGEASQENLRLLMPSCPQAHSSCRGVQPTVHGPNMAQDGFEWGPTQNCKFT